jgi:hypothetical protein
MDINSRFNFGRYKGLPIRNVFTGTKDIDRDLLSAYLKYRLKEGDIHNVEDEITVNMFNFEINRTTIKLTPTLPDFKVDASKSLEEFFRSGDSLASKLTNLSLDKFCYEIYNKKYDSPLSVGGIPGYIEWCIKTIENFFINPNQIKQLEDDGVNYFLGIKAKLISEYMYEYAPNILYKPYRFDETILKINKSKADQSS